MLIFIIFYRYCLLYTSTKNISAKETLLLFSTHGVFEFLYENFEMLHTQDTEFILSLLSLSIAVAKVDKILISAIA